ncbi:MAG TPA: hypothetical protein VHB21_18055 [Minicystis sp.]|nr:hypothetical protein [Minicystis sp.]
MTQRRNAIRMGLAGVLVAAGTALVAPHGLAQGNAFTPGVYSPACSDVKGDVTISKRERPTDGGTCVDVELKNAGARTLILQYGAMTNKALFGEGMDINFKPGATKKFSGCRSDGLYYAIVIDKAKTSGAFPPDGPCAAEMQKLQRSIEEQLCSHFGKHYDDRIRDCK